MTCSVVFYRGEFDDNVFGVLSGSCVTYILDDPVVQFVSSSLVGSVAIYVLSIPVDSFYPVMVFTASFEGQSDLGPGLIQVEFAGLHLGAVQE